MQQAVIDRSPDQKNGHVAMSEAEEEAFVRAIGYNVRGKRIVETVGHPSGLIKQKKTYMWLSLLSSSQS